MGEKYDTLKINPLFTAEMYRVMSVHTFKNT